MGLIYNIDREQRIISARISLLWVKDIRKGVKEAIPKITLAASLIKHLI